jgi:hypothetical protein
MSQNFPDESMAVNVSAFTTDRIQDLDPDFESQEQDEEQQDHVDQDLEDQIDQLARERAASACRYLASYPKNEQCCAMIIWI